MENVEATPNEQISMHIKSLEFLYPVNYSLMIFDNRNKTVLNERFLTGLLNIENSEKTLLVYLKRTGLPFKNYGRAYAFYRVNGKVNMNDCKNSMGEVGYGNSFILKSEILFEGRIQLIQTK